MSDTELVVLARRAALANAQIDPNKVGSMRDILGAIAAQAMTKEELAHAPSAWLTPAQLADLDRALTPEEQKRVDDWQIAQGNAARAQEEKPYVDPKTGKLAQVKVDYAGDVGMRLAQFFTPKPAPGEPAPAPPDKASAAAVFAVVSIVSLLGLGATIALIAKAKYALAAATFFVATPVVASVSGYAALALSRKGGAKA